MGFKTDPVGDAQAWADIGRQQLSARINALEKEVVDLETKLYEMDQNLKWLLKLHRDDYK